MAVYIFTNYIIYSTRISNVVGSINSYLLIAAKMWMWALAKPRIILVFFGQEHPADLKKKNETQTSLPSWKMHMLQ